MWNKILIILIMFLMVLIVSFSGCTNSNKNYDPEPTQTVQKEDLNQYVKIVNWTYKRANYGYKLNISGEVENIGNKTIGPVYVTAKGYHNNGKENPGSENETYVGDLEPGEIKRFTMILRDAGNNVLSSKKIDIRAYVKE